jgi:hypothetical protein
MRIGVPLDGDYRRQPLLARIRKNSDLIDSNRIETMFQNIPSVRLPEVIHEVKNFNNLNDFTES